MKDMIRRILLLAAALVLAAGFSLPAFAEEEEIPLEDLDLADIETVNLETPLVANPRPSISPRVTSRRRADTWMSIPTRIPPSR